MKSYQFSILYPVKISFNNEKDNRDFSDKRMVKEVVSAEILEKTY